MFAPELMWELSSPEQFDAAAAHVRPEDVEDAVIVSADPAEHAARIAELADGFDEVYLHQVGGAQEQRRFIDVFGERVLPRLAGGT